MLLYLFEIWTEQKLGMQNLRENNDFCALHFSLKLMPLTFAVMLWTKWGGKTGQFDYWMPHFVRKKTLIEILPSLTNKHDARPPISNYS